MGTTLAKKAQGYGYKYTELSEIHEWLESQGITYYQYIEPIDGADYIYTVPIINGEEKPARRGCKVIIAELKGKTNAAQEQGSGITYARRYSLLMAFGLATADDDAACMTVKKEDPAPKVEGEIVKKDKKEVIPGYPGRDKMIEVAKKHYPEGSEVLNILLQAASAEKLEDLTDEQLGAIYNKYGGR